MNGRDISVEFTPAEGPGQFPKTSIRVKPNVTPLTEDKNVLEMVAKNQPNLTEIFKEPSYDELKEALATWLNPEGDDTTDTPAASSNNEKSDLPWDNEDKKETVKAGVNKVDDVSAAFDDLFND